MLSMLRCCGRDQVLSYQARRSGDVAALAVGGSALGEVLPWLGDGSNRRRGDDEAVCGACDPRQELGSCHKTCPRSRQLSSGPLRRKGLSSAHLMRNSPHCPPTVANGTNSYIYFCLRALNFKRQQNLVNILSSSQRRDAGVSLQAPSANILL
jgi:hypothetical protein